MKFNDTLKLIFSLLVCQLAGVVGSIFTLKSISTWYPTLIKPFLNPPNWLFGPVWTTLYILMGIACFIIWKKYSYVQEISEQKIIKNGMILFDIQLVLNALWPVVFFGAQNLGVSLIEILVLFTFVVLTTVKFFKISKVAGWLLVPYVLWTGFAIYLNYSIWILN